MSGHIVHKESLPAQIGIKRRRTAAPVVFESSGTQIDLKTTESSNLEVKGNDDQAKEEEQYKDHNDASHIAMRSPGEATERHSGDTDEGEGDDESDMEELEMERQRIEELRLKKKLERNEKDVRVTRDGATHSSANGFLPSGITTAGAINELPSSAHVGVGSNCSIGGISAYNHDVLFRRRERDNANGAITKCSKKAKWEAVTNDTQKSASYRHFMKSYFK
ncbi:hypothetical protein ERJ75_001439900 [Trypanosoma vivax]|nr:hypothetical protein TRVL_04241 [Trypanosoma vivax]KAH8607217.1 hypothetical protein ERJ75_001439900 [Trypanosoma vivax]